METWKLVKVECKENNLGTKCAEDVIVSLSGLRNEPCFTDDDDDVPSIHPDSVRSVSRLHNSVVSRHNSNKAQFRVRRTHFGVK